MITSRYPVFTTDGLELLDMLQHPRQGSIAGRTEFVGQRKVVGEAGHDLEPRRAHGLQPRTHPVQTILRQWAVAKGIEAVIMLDPALRTPL